MVHMAAGALGVLQPHFAPDKTTIAKEYYVSHVLGAHVIPRARAVVASQEGPAAKWTWMQDLASPHTARHTMDFLKRERVSVLPWFPKGADVNPLDVFVWGSVGKRLKALPPGARDTQAKLRVALAQVIDEAMSGEIWVGRVKKCCNGVKRRLEWVLVHDGEEIKGEKWRKETFEEGWAGRVKNALKQKKL